MAVQNAVRVLAKAIDITAFFDCAATFGYIRTTRYTFNFSPAWLLRQNWPSQTLSEGWISRGHYEGTFTGETQFCIIFCYLATFPVFWHKIQVSQKDAPLHHIFFVWFWQLYFKTYNQSSTHANKRNQFQGYILQRFFGTHTHTINKFCHTLQEEPTKYDMALNLDTWIWQLLEANLPASSLMGKHYPVQ